jgi:hypothetical protein
MSVYLDGNEGTFTEGSPVKRKRARKYQTIVPLFSYLLDTGKRLGISIDGSS